MKQTPPSALPRFAPATLPQNVSGRGKSGRKVERRLDLLRGGIDRRCAYELAASRAKGGGMPMGKDCAGGGAPPGLFVVRKIGGAEPAAVRKAGGAGAERAAVRKVGVCTRRA